ncbi:MAG TPA: MarR family transcriptional regulator [Steroidobacteraceae bacterium]|nr:MarR family transcriptional regulator [Steroidobacteraceae bacterium]
MHGEGPEASTFNARADREAGSDLPTGAAVPVANELRRGVASLARRLRGMRAPHGIAATKLSLLGRLARAHHPLTASELAALERLQPQSLTRIIAELEEQGLIRREPDQLDRRALLIEATERGRQLLIEDARRQNRWLATVMAQTLTAAEIRLLGIAAELLEQLADLEARELHPATEPRADAEPPQSA